MVEVKDLVLILIDVGLALTFYKYKGLSTALASLAGNIFYFLVLR